MIRLALGLLMAVVVLGWGAPSWADKVSTPLVFDNPSLTAVLSIYETTADHQADVAKVLLKTSRSFYKPIAGFERLALLNSTDGTRIASLSLWQDASSYEAFQASLTTDNEEDFTKYYEKFVKDRPGGSASLLEPPDPLFTATFTLDQTMAPPSLRPITVGEGALVQIIGLGANTPDQGARVLATAQATLDALPSLYPAPRSSLLFRAVTFPYVALVSNWGAVEEFGDISQIPAIPIISGISTPLLPMAEPPDPAQNDAPNEAMAQEARVEPAALAINTDPADWLSQEDHLYQLVKVVAPKVYKYESSPY